MTAPPKRNKQNGMLVVGEHDNPAFDESKETVVGSNDVTVKMKETSFTENHPSNFGVAVNNNQTFRDFLPSVSYSVNYDDIISAEKLADDISTAESSSAQYATPPLRRRSFLQRRRISRDPIEEEDDDVSQRELVLKIRKTMPLKDFRHEVRAYRDLEKFLISPVVMLDVNHTNLRLIVRDLIDKLRKDLEGGEKINYEEAEKSFFTYQDQYSEAAGSIDHLRETIHGIRYRAEGTEYEESWITAVCSLPMLKRSHVGVVRLRHPLNLGNRCEEIVFIVVVLAPKKEKFTKNAVEIGRTFSSLMMNSSFRHRLAEAKTEDEFKNIFVHQSTKYKELQAKDKSGTLSTSSQTLSDYSFLQFGRGLCDDLRRRLPYYYSDFRDGIVGKHTIHKLLATVLFLYFACLLPDIAFGTLYEKDTNGIIDVTSCIMSQTIGGLAFALFSGQPMLVLLTTAPLALYVKVIMLVSDSFSLDFRAMYTMVGVWNTIFLVLESLFNMSKMMKYSSRSTEEIFGFFIALAFSGDAIKATISNFKKNYHFLPENSSDFTTNFTSTDCASESLCYRPENSILFLFLMLATVWVGMTLLSFDESRFLSATKREILADYALPIAVLALSFVGSYLFQDIPLEKFKYNPDKINFIVPDVTQLPATAHLAAAGLGLCLSCLFFVDQNVSAALVNAPHNKLKKGPAYHWDLFVVGLINLPLSLFNLPWVHAALPHSPLHVKALADVEQHVSNFGTVHDEGINRFSVYRIVKVRETRLTTIFSHVLIGLSLLIIPILQYVPVAVLQGLFLYLGLSSFIGNQMFDRMMLIFTEGSSYPPNHYVRKVPQRKLHLFTFCQVVQLVVVSVFGFVDLFYLKMIFPVIILLLLPIRHKILPRIVSKKYLTVLDSD